jgi:hypothetical protein
MLTSEDDDVVFGHFCFNCSVQLRCGCELFPSKFRGSKWHVMAVPADVGGESRRLRLHTRREWLQHVNSHQNCKHPCFQMCQIILAFQWSSDAVIVAERSGKWAFF